MPKLIPLLALCAACSPTSGKGEDTAAPTTRTYATQIKAPTPDYRRLLDQAPIANGNWRPSETTSPAPPDAKAVGMAWLARLETRKALLGYGLAGKSPEGAVRMIDTGLTRKEFESWTRENGWRVPGHIRWSFVPEMTLPPVSAAAIGSIRVWPASTARTGAQNQALFYGRVELRNGCFFVGENGQPANKLAWFHAEMGLDIDSAGFFILRERGSGKTLARLGEEMNWGGPATAIFDDKVKLALQKACGEGELYVVGSPESSERFLTQFPHLRHPQASPPPPRPN